jgi:hypothetical protein
MRVLHSFGGQLGMQARGVRNLWHLAHAEPEARRLILREGGLEATLAAMRMHGDNPEMQTHALRLIWKVLVLTF